MVADDGIPSALRRMRESREWDRVNPGNPPCRGCLRRYTPDGLTEGVCAECLDLTDLVRTGCLHARVPCCGSEDCTMPFSPDEEEAIRRLGIGTS